VRLPISCYLLCVHSEVLLEKHWRGKMKRTICEVFWEEVNKVPNRFEVRGSPPTASRCTLCCCWLPRCVVQLLPIFATPKCYMIATYRFGLFWLTCVQKELQPLLILETQARIIDVLVQVASNPPSLCILSLSHLWFMCLQYFSDGRLNESILRENFSTVLQVTAHARASK
jgi:hypothetical protein